MDYLSIPQVCLYFQLRSKTYLKEHPPSTNKDFPLSSKPEHWFTHTREGANYTAAQ